MNDAATAYYLPGLEAPSDLPDEGLAVSTVAQDRGDMIDVAAYEAAIRGAHEAFVAAPNYGNALRLSKTILHAAIDCSAPDVDLVLSSSYGKDSSALLSVLKEVYHERKEEGRRVPATLIAVAHTANEFPAMVARIEAENVAIEKWGKRLEVNLSTVVVGPKPSQRLFAQICGNGRALPKYSSSTKADSASWCVERLKTGPIYAAIAAAKGRHARMLHLTGVRSEESARRAATMARHSEGLPFGLSTMAERKGKRRVEDLTRLGVPAIGFWSFDHLKLHLRMSAFDVGFMELTEIYRKGADVGDVDSVKACEITNTPDGEMTSVCSDLSGSRMGCVTCVRSLNRSLVNYARNESRYVWINRLHKFIYRGIAEHNERIRDRDAHGFTAGTMFPKTLTFRYRYFVLMFVFRAELESGLPLIDADECKAIEAWWRRAGVFTVTTEDALQDARRWKATGKIAMRWEAADANYEMLATSLSEGIPGGIYSHLLDGAASERSLDIANLMPLTGRGNSFYPRMRAYVFRDKSSRGGYMTLLTDVPSDMGRRTNTDAMSGFEGVALELIAERESTSWEKQFMRGRVLFYRHTDAAMQALIAARSGMPYRVGFAPRDLPSTRQARKLKASATSRLRRRVWDVSADLYEVMLANMELNPGCSEHALADHFVDTSLIARSAGKFTEESLGALKALVSEAADISDVLSDIHVAVHRTILREHRALLDRVGSDKLGRGDGESRDWVKAMVSRHWDMKQSLLKFLFYVSVMRDLDTLIREGAATTEVINRLAFISRYERYDPDYAAGLMAELVRLLEVARSRPRVAA